MTSVRVSSLGFAVAAVTIGGCASLPAAKGSTAESVCVNKRDINSISALDDQHAFVKVSAGRFYLVTVDKACRGLAVARAIAIVDATARVCGDGLTLLSFENPTVGPMRCRIEGIDSVADKNAARDLIESRAPPE